MNQIELEKYLWEAATTLRGTIDAGDYKQFIFPLMFLKRICDVYDEEHEKALKESDNDKDYASFKEQHRFQIPKGSHWNDLRSVTTNVGLKIQNCMNNIERANLDILNGIFGDANWSNKERLSDETLINLIEHYSSYKMNLKNIPSDKLGNAYEFLIKKFADDSGHTAAEFYTNRTVVKLMTKIMDPKPGESVYDPTCGSGGLLLNCALYLKEQNKEFRNIKLYGQEINLLTSSIAKINLLLHDIIDFKIIRGDTISNPGFIEGDKLKKFDVILANPPYSIKNWDRNNFINDKFRRNIWGVPPQNYADYVFEQHIDRSMKSDSGRCIQLWPHGILFRDGEKEIRNKMIKTDSIDCIISLGKNLFYNSSMESCLLIRRNKKEKKRKKNILFINAYNEVKHEKNLSYLLDSHINKIYNAFLSYEDIEGFSKVVSIDEVFNNDSSLQVTKYVKSPKFIEKNDAPFEKIYTDLENLSLDFEKNISTFFSFFKK